MKDILHDVEFRFYVERTPLASVYDVGMAYKDSLQTRKQFSNDSGIKFWTDWEFVPHVTVSG